MVGSVHSWPSLLRRSSGSSAGLPVSGFGSHHARFEAFAVALMKVVNFDGKTFEELKQRILRRHKDGPNNHCAGCKERLSLH
jgi:hypothetical protein